MNAEMPIQTHTPGPWKQLHSDGSMIVANGIHVASVPVGGPIDDPEFKANARLIAAAPDMLAALKSIAANTCCDTCREAALVAKSALSKAQSIQSHSKGERE